jgi:hypothetical protein
MSRLYIANPTLQKQIICYRLDYSSEGEMNANSRFQAARQQDCEPGRQVQIGGDFHPMQIKEILDQLTTFGMIRVEDVTRLGRMPATYIASVDKAIPADVIRKVRDHNAKLLIEEGQERRKKAAIASESIVQNTVAQQLSNYDVEVPADRTEVSFEQLDQSEAGEKMIAEGYKIEQSGSGSGSSGGGGNRWGGGKSGRRK